tara:strand:+ start:539 stop:2434 length:1896 start_codon:yes stop_codon:yes gene_type:complete
MAIYRSDQAQLTFGVEAAPGGDPEMAEGTQIAGPSPTLGSAATVGDRTITLSAEFTALKSSAGTAILIAEGLDASETGIDVDANHDLIAGRIIKIDSEEFYISALASTNTLTVSARPYGGTTAATHSDDAPILTRFAAGDFVRIGTLAGTVANTVVPHEIRRVEGVSGADLILDRPLAFSHASGQLVLPVSATAIGGTDGRNSANMFIDLIPGVYESVDLPDPEMTIEPSYFLGTASKRNFFGAYSGQQTYTGSISDFVLLNGKALRFPIGKVSTVPSTVADDTILLNQASGAKKGDLYITCDGANVGNLAVNDYIQIDTTSGKSEVRQILADVSDTFKLDYPLQFDHDDNCVINEVASGAYYTHTIEETVALDSISWHAHMRASNELATHDFDRRYFGGKVGSASISAEEGGMVTMSWDSVNFLGMVHNQQYNSAYSITPTTQIPFYSLMQSIDSDEVNFPTNDPYYFSQGEVTMFGQTLARIRNFTLSINNNEEPRYYITKQMGRRRGPTEIMEQRREYTMSATMALPDTTTSSNAAARTLFTELLLEGDYGSGKAGFNITLTFTRGDNDSITITIPDDGSAGTGGNNQGAYIRTAPHNLGEESPFQVEADILFRNMKVTVVDSEHYYP